MNWVYITLAFGIGFLCITNLAWFKTAIYWKKSSDQWKRMCHENIALNEEIALNWTKYVADSINVQLEMLTEDSNIPYVITYKPFRCNIKVGEDSPVEFEVISRNFCWHDLVALISEIKEKSQ